VVARFDVTRTDVDLILAELHHDPPDGLNAPLLGALLAAVTSFDSGTGRLGTCHEPTTDLLLPEKHAQAFREWLERAVMRRRDTGDHAKAQVFARVHGSERWRVTAVRGQVPVAPQESDDGELRQESRRLIAASRGLVALARAHIQATNHGIANARRRLERSRDVLQVAWLRRALHRRHTPHK
jgi:hypothetical protein